MRKGIVMTMMAFIYKFSEQETGADRSRSSGVSMEEELW